MSVRRVYAHENIEADRGKVALMRGPIVYCLEAVDHLDTDIANIALPRRSDFRTEHRPQLLGGVTTLKARALTEDRKPVNLTAVPYYAWANRDRGPMTIWIDETPTTP